MIRRDDLPETPEWELPARDEPAAELTIPPNITLGAE
jgi:hypothetical protein